MRDLSDISTAYDDKITEEYRCEFSQQMTAGQQPGVTGMRALSSEFSVEGRDFLMMTIGTRSRVYLMTDKRGGPKKSSLELVETADEYSEGQVDHFLAHHSRNGYTFTVKVLSDGSTEIGRFCEAAADSYYKDLLPSEFKNALKTSYNYLKFKCTDENNEVLSTAVHADFVDEHLVGYFEGSAATVYVCKLSISKINEYIHSLRKLCLEGIGSDDVEVIGSGQCSSNLKNFVNCGAVNSFHLYYRGLFAFGKSTPVKVPFTSKISLTNSEQITSIKTFSVNNNLYTFVGTTKGIAHKFIIRDSAASIAESVLVSTKLEPVIKIAAATKNSDGVADNVLALTKNKLSLFPAESCETQYTDCQSCLMSRDPHCGWCVYSARCTISSKCEMQNSGKIYWIPTTNEPESCPSFTISPKNIVVGKEQVVQITFKELQIVLNSSFTLTANAQSTSIKFDFSNTNPNGFTANLPALSTALLPINKNHVPVTINIEINDRIIVSSSFTLYDCAKTRQEFPKQACSKCLQQEYTCSWCGSSSSCSNEDCGLFTIDKCPTVKEVTSSKSIPSHKSAVVQLKAVNLDINKKYDCGITSCDGQLYRSPATVSNNIDNSFSVECNIASEQLSCNKTESFVEVLLYDMELIIDAESKTGVTVFNCDSGSLLTCGECIALHHNYPTCVWCEDTQSCQSSNTCVDNRVTEMKSCGSMVIESIDPKSGPLEGGTVLKVEGVNIGSRLIDLEKIQVKTVDCEIKDETYVTSKSFECKLKKGGPKVYGVLNIHTTYNVTGSSIETYHFKNVEYERFDKVLVINNCIMELKGINMNIGNKLTFVLTTITVQETKLDEIDCTNRKNESLSCKLPLMPIGSYKLFAKLDGSEIIITENITYTPLPEIDYIGDFSAFTSAGGKVQIKLKPIFATIKWWKAQLMMADVLTNCTKVKYREEQQAKNLQAAIDCHIPSNPAQERKINNSTHKRNFFKRALEDTNSYLVINEDTENKKFIGRVVYQEDPVLEVIDEIPCSTDGTIVISAIGFAATGLTAEDYTVHLDFASANTKLLCEVTYISETSMLCKVDNNQLGNLENTKVSITVMADQFEATLSEVPYCTGQTELYLKIIIPMAATLLLVIAVASFYLRRNRTKRKKGFKLFMSKIEDMENATRETARDEFFQLQTGYMDDFENKISQNISYHSPTRYFSQTFFNKTKDLPVHKESNFSEPLSKKLASFEKLLNKQEFLVFLIKTLEEQKKFNVLQKGELASLLAVTFYDDLPYFTRVMLQLLADVVKAQASKNPKLLLRRSASVVEKMVSHWLSITMYDEYIYEQSGKPLFLLTKAIHYLVNLAPWDLTSDKAINSLNEITLLNQNIEYTTIELNASIQGSETGETIVSSKPIKLLNIDTITQAKSKIIEGLFSEKPYSEQPKPSELEMIILRTHEYENEKQSVLNDVDKTSEVDGNNVKINTLQHYNVLNTDTLLLKPRPLNGDRESQAGDFNEFISRVKSFSRSMEFLRNMQNEDTELMIEKNRKLYHLVPPKEETSLEYQQRKRADHLAITKYKKNPIKEIFLTRMLKAKNTIQVYVDEVVRSILKPEKVPLGVRYFFAFLDNEAAKNKINDKDVLHIWKTNSLLLRYWVNILKNPEFVFDIHKTAIVDSCLNVITQAFMDGCTINSVPPTKDAPTNKLLFLKEVQQYKIWVKEFFVKVTNQKPVSNETMDDFLFNLSKKFPVQFNKKAAVEQIFNWMKTYSKEILEAMEANENLYISNYAYQNVKNLLKIDEGELSFPTNGEISV